MDTMPTNTTPPISQTSTQEPVSHKGIAFLFIAVVVVILGGLGYWMMTVIPPEKNNTAEQPIVPGSQRVDDSSVTIEQELNAVNVNEIDVDAEVRSTDSDLQQL